VRRRRRFRLAVACLVLPGLFALGCGNERQNAPKLPQAATPSGKREVRLKAYGMTFERPRNWAFVTGRAPQVATVGSGRAIVTVWRYKRVESLPKSNADLLRSRKALVAAVRQRDRTARILFARGTRLGGTPAVVIVANEKIGLVRRKVRSTHLFAHGAEVVVDAYAPMGEFASLDRSAFQPLVRSMRLTQPPAPRRS
jgi:hypothetical protein